MPDSTLLSKRMREGLLNRRCNLHRKLCCRLHRCPRLGGMLYSLRSSLHNWCGNLCSGVSDMSRPISDMRTSTACVIVCSVTGGSIVGYLLHDQVSSAAASLLFVGTLILTTASELLFRRSRQRLVRSDIPNTRNPEDGAERK